MTQAVNLANAINSFVVGCKQDGIWDSIKACCVMAAWDGLAGALYPLKGTAPTNYNFVQADYDRETGLVGDGSTKYLDSNRANDADPQDSNHNALFVSSLSTITQVLIGPNGGDVPGNNSILRYDSSLLYRNRCLSAVSSGLSGFPGLVGTNRNTSSGYVIRINKANTTVTTASQTPFAQSVGVFGGFGGDTVSSSRIAFYSIGEALDLALLDARVTTLINAIGAAL